MKNKIYRFFNQEKGVLFLLCSIFLLFFASENLYGQVTITGTTPVCPGSIETYSVDDVESYWTVDPSKGIFVGPDFGASVSIQWIGNGTTADISVWSYREECGMVDPDPYEECGWEQVYICPNNSGCYTEYQFICRTIDPTPYYECRTVGYSGAKRITIYPRPTLFNVTGGGATCNGGNLSFPIGLSGSNGGATYQLYRDNTLLSTVTSPASGGAFSFGNFKIPGTYTVAYAAPCTSVMMNGNAIISDPRPSSFTAWNDGPKCATDPAPIVNLGATNISGATYYWTGPYNAHQTTSVNTTSVNGLAGTFDYTVYASINGCTTSTATTSVMLYPAPPQTFAGADQNLCALTTTLYASPAGTGFIGHWDQVAGPGSTQFQDAGAYNTTVSVTTPGTYTYRWTISGASVCTPSTAQVSVTFNIAPVIYAVTSGSGGSRCSNSAPITISLAGSQTGINYQLKINGTNAGAAVAGTGSALTWSDMGSGTYSIQAVGTGGCTQLMTGTPVMTVNPAPAVYTVGGGGAVCSGSPFAITLSGSNTGVNYVLTRGATTIGTLAGTGSSLSWGNQVLPGTFTITATNATSGCTQSMGSATVTLNALPSLYSVSGGGDRCDNQPGLTVSLNGSQANVITYQLNRNNLNVGTPVTGTGSALSWSELTDAGSYTIQAIHSNGCTRTMTNTVVINTKAAPTIANAGPDVNSCGQEITLSANMPTVGTGAWAQVSGPVQSHIVSPLSPNTVVSVPQPNTYVYAWTITNSNGCTSTDNVRVIFNATATPASAGLDQTVCGDLFATMSGNTPLVGNGEWIQISGPSGAVFFPDSNTPDAYLFASEPGTYVYRWTITNQPCASSTDDVQITFSTGCSARAAQANVESRKQTAALSESSDRDSEAVQVYPIPASQAITVEIPFEGTWKVELRNMNGALVKTLTCNGKTSTLEVSELPAGFYVLHVQGSNKRFIKKVEVIR